MRFGLKYKDMKKAVILYGPPGSGKGTQANLLAVKHNLIHFDTGKFLEGIVMDPKRQKSAIIRRERKLFNDGKLMTPSWVLSMVKREAKNIARAGYGIIFSGSPRTMLEAKGLLPVLSQLYGAKNIHVFVLEVSAKVSTKRNSSRLVCKFCGYGLLSAFYPTKDAKQCPVCGGSFYKRTLDNPKTIQIRLKEYEERTFPIFDFLKKKGARVVELDATPAPFEVFEKIEKALGSK